MTVKGGRLVVVGIPRQRVAMNSLKRAVYERFIVGCGNAGRGLPHLASLIAETRLALGSRTFRSFPHNEVPAELRRLRNAPEGTATVVIRVKSAR